MEALELMLSFQIYGEDDELAGGDWKEEKEGWNESTLRRDLNMQSEAFPYGTRGKRPKKGTSPSSHRRLDMDLVSHTAFSSTHVA